MYKSLKTMIKFFTAAVFVSFSLATATSLQAGTVVQCGAAVCSSDFTLMFNGNAAGGGELLYDSKSGDITLNTDASSLSGNATVMNGGVMWTMSDGSTMMLNSLSGNADPILGFGLGATTGASASTFGFTFNLPIALTGPINASSSVSYTLTSLTGAGAQIAPVVGSNIVSAFEVDSSVGGLSSLNKGVDVGSTFFFVGGPSTSASPVYTATNSFTGDLAYDLMTVKVDFSLSSNTTVGVSGFVSQLPVPLPASVWLFGSALLGLLGIARRKNN